MRCSSNRKQTIKQRKVNVMVAIIKANLGKCGVAGAAVGAGIEAVSGIADLANERRDAGGVANSVAIAGANGLAASAAASTVASNGGITVADTVRAGAIAAASPIALAGVVGYAALKVIDWLTE